MLVDPIHSKIRCCHLLQTNKINRAIQDTHHMVTTRLVRAQAVRSFRTNSPGGTLVVQATCMAHLDHPFNRGLLPTCLFILDTKWEVE